MLWPPIFMRFPIEEVIRASDCCAMTCTKALPSLWTAPPFAGTRRRKRIALAPDRRVGRRHSESGHNECRRAVQGLDVCVPERVGGLQMRQ